MLLQYWYTITITHRRDVGGVTAICSIVPLPLHIIDGQLGRLEGHALQEIQISNSSHFLDFFFSTFWSKNSSTLVFQIILREISAKLLVVKQIDNDKLFCCKFIAKHPHSITYTNTRPKLLCFRRRKRFQKETVVVSTNINILLLN